MIQNFPKSIASKAVTIYIAAVAVASLVFYKYAMNFSFILFGVAEVMMFFFGVSHLTSTWAGVSAKTFERRLFWWAFAIRVCWVVFSYFFFKANTGQPFEFGAADALGYQGAAEWLSGSDWSVVMDYLFHSRSGVSDSGYIFYLTILYRIIGVNIILARVIKSLLGAYLCVLMFRLASRNFGLPAGRMTGIFCMLMPNLIWYCGIHLKEAEMVFLTVLCIERADYALRSGGRNKLSAFCVSGVSALILFGFRTALAAIILLSVGCALFLSSSDFLARWKKWLYGSLLALGLVATLGQSIVSEVTEMWAERNSSQQNMLEFRATRDNGNMFAKYASRSVFIPLIFTIPFPTVVDIEGQENQQIISGGNYVKNILSFFTIFALIMLLINGTWRQHVLPMAFICGYLLVVACSAFAQSERFHLPALPFTLMFAAYGIVNLNARGVKVYKYWPYFIFVIIIAWCWFKLAGRGLV